MEFFSKDPAKQLVEVKEKLTQRLVSRRREYEYLDRIWPRRVVNMFRVTEEIEFLEKLLDQMERS